MKKEWLSFDKYTFLPEQEFDLHAVACFNSLHYDLILYLPYFRIFFWNYILIPVAECFVHVSN